jgi:protein-S-isoprenylcysteine O-methyltransferase Ste14
MLSSTLIAEVLLLYLTLFFAFNLQNVVKGSQMRKGKNAYAEIERPGGFLASLAAFGTLAFFVEAALLVYYGFTGNAYDLAPALQLRFRYDAWIQALGLAVMGSGFLIFTWSVVVRGRHSVSWEMPEDHILVKRGPYHHVRHPSYLGYFLIFSGLPLAWLNLAALVPMVAIPGYVAVANTEEALLISRFGEEYLEYMESVGRFIPKRAIRKRSIG